MKISIGALFFAAVLPLAAREVIQADIVVFGGTSGGIAAAMQAKRMGKTAVIAEWTQHLGGLTTGGLGATDIGNKAAIGGIAREFYEQIAAHYARPEAWTWEQPQNAAGPSYHERSSDPLVEKTGRPTKWTFEPYVAMGIYKKWLADAGVKVYFGQKLARVKQRGGRIVEFSTEDGHVFRGKMFIDASYEGDLMAKAGVSYHVGREANTVHGETLNGVRAYTPQHQFLVDVDPYVRPGDPSSGLLPFIQPGDGGKPGDGDRCVQAYNFRLCMTRTQANLVPWAQIKPPGYDEKRYEVLARLIEQHEKEGKPLPLGKLMNPVKMPNDKTDTNNNGPFSTDHIGANYDYPDGDYALRERIRLDHEHYIEGFLYFLSTSPRVPQRLRDEMNAWGLAKDEFVSTGHFPPQMYVREARRMVSDYVMTEADCRWQRKAEDPVGMGAYNMDSHNCQRLVQNGVVRNEGDVQVGVSGPYPVSYRSLVPGRGQCKNLFVPVCMAASHIAYGSIRMEPVFMILSQSAATAAAMAIDAKTAVQDVPYARLREKLLADGQVLEWTGGPKGGAFNYDAKSFPGIVLDDEQAELKGPWAHSTSVRCLGIGYRHDADGSKGQCQAIFRPVIPTEGEYEIFLLYPPMSNRARNTPVRIEIQGSPSRMLQIDQRKTGTNNATSLGRFRLVAGRSVAVTVSNEDTEGHVIADGLQVLPLAP